MVSLLRLTAGRKSPKTDLESWEIISGFSVKQIQQALAGAKDAKEGTVEWGQKTLLYYRWAAIDPAPALAAARADIGSGDSADGNPPFLQAAFSAWFQASPDAAYRWAEDETSKQPVDAAGVNRAPLTYHRAYMARLLTLLPVEDALRKARAYDTEMEAVCMSRFTIEAAPEDREKLLEQFSTLESFRKAPSENLLSIIRAWSKTDLPAAISKIDSLEVDSSQKESWKKEILQGMSIWDPVKAFDWLSGSDLEYKVNRQADAYTMMQMGCPEEAAARFADVVGHSPELTEAVMGRLLTRAQKVDLSYFPASRQQERNFKSLSQHFEKWSVVAPDAAAAWLRKADRETRSLLTPVAGP